MADAPGPGTILLDKYCVERVLGRGGMGFVVAVRHLRLGELFALKMLRSDLQNRADANERFLREARALARLRGEHVVRVQDVGSFEDGSSYMLMEYLQGRDLKQVLDDRGPLPIDDVALYVMQAGEAIAEAHEQGIIHRDLKPANMFLTMRPNGTPCVKVLDFGISKEILPSSPDLTRTGAFVGSPGYVSPERLANNKVAHAQSDIWALGVVLYELISGKLPFRAKLLADLVAQIVASPAVPLGQLRPDVPPEFEAVVMRCLEKRPENRYASVRELIAALEPFAASNQRPKTKLNAPQSRPGEEATVLLPMNVPPMPIFPVDDAPISYGHRAIQTTSPRAFGQTPDLVRTSELVPSERTGHTNTNGGWGNTWHSLIQKDKGPIILGAAVIISMLCVGGLFFALSPSSNTEPSSSITEPSKGPSAASTPGQTSTISAEKAITTIPTTPASASAMANPTPPPPVDVATEGQTVQDSPNGAASAKTAVPQTTVPKAPPTKRRTIRGYDE